MMTDEGPEVITVEQIAKTETTVRYFDNEDNLTSEVVTTTVVFHPKNDSDVRTGMYL